jgi:ribose transport system ATP-binding protein
MSAPVLEIANLSKTFPGTRALSDVSLEVGRSEIHALVGQNGSGKSTLIKVLSGFHRPDPGASARLNGEPFNLEDSERTGDALRFVHQELGLILELGAADNLALLGGFPLAGGGSLSRRIDWRRQRQESRQALARFGIEIDVDAPLHEATAVERAVVAISGALQHWQGGAGVLVLDEPTAVLPPHEVGRLHEIVREVRRQGTSVLYVSHRLDELFGLADRVTVLRGGKVSARRLIDELDKSALASLIVGREIDVDQRSAPAAEDSGATVCEVRDLRSAELRGVDVTIRRGEILGVAGLPGSGIKDLPYAIAGAIERCEGEIRLDGEGDWLPIAQAARLNVPLVPADRATEAVIEQLSVKENLTLGVLDAISGTRGLSGREEDQLYETWARQMEIKAGSKDDPITTLSGGNQQKVIMARCLAREPKLLAMCEPTAGVDAGTRQAIHAFTAAMVERGLSLIVSSTDLDDLMAMCTRVIVMAHGEVVRTLAQSELSEENLIDAMEGS